MAAVTETGSLYSAPVAFIYVFNLIIGVGALTMPKAFANAGWLIAIVLIAVLCFMSFVTTTFMVEAMAAANAVLRLRTRDRNLSDSLGPHEVESSRSLPGSNSVTDHECSPSDESCLSHEDEPLLVNGDKFKLGQDLYDITTRVEMGQMANLFFNKIGIRLFYFCIALYLYGDLAIYAAAVPKSLTQVACGSLKGNDTAFSNSKPCWGSVTEINVYRIFLAIFSVTLGPFAFLNVQKTKYLQIFTSLMRWIAFVMMIVLAVVKISKPGGAQHDTPAVNFSGLPNLFGVCIYSYMCQHSIPSLITPMKNKSRVTLLFIADFSIVMVFYALLSFSAIFAFRADELDDLYTLNFMDSGKFVGYFLALFPVFTLSTNFPIISITLRDNLKNLFHREGRPYPWAVDKIVFPLITITLPIAVAFATQNLEILVGVTGSYAGAAVQYVIPASLAYYGRRYLIELTGCYDNKHRSPFRQLAWIIFVVGWATVCIAFVTANHIVTRK